MPNENFLTFSPQALYDKIEQINPNSQKDLIELKQYLNKYLNPLSDRSNKLFDIYQLFDSHKILPITVSSNEASVTNETSISSEALMMERVKKIDQLEETLKKEKEKKFLEIEKFSTTVACQMLGMAQSMMMPMDIFLLCAKKGKKIFEMIICDFNLFGIDFLSTQSRNYWDRFFDTISKFEKYEVMNIFLDKIDGLAVDAVDIKTALLENANRSDFVSKETFLSIVHRLDRKEFESFLKSKKLIFRHDITNYINVRIEFINAFDLFLKTNGRDYWRFLNLFLMNYIEYRDFFDRFQQTLLPNKKSNETNGVNFIMGNILEILNLLRDALIADYKPVLKPVLPRSVSVSTLNLSSGRNSPEKKMTVSNSKSVLKVHDKLVKREKIKLKENFFSEDKFSKPYQLEKDGVFQTLLSTAINQRQKDFVEEVLRSKHFLELTFFSGKEGGENSPYRLAQRAILEVSAFSTEFLELLLAALCQFNKSSRIGIKTMSVTSIHVLHDYCFAFLNAGQVGPFNLVLNYISSDEISYDDFIRVAEKILENKKDQDPFAAYVRLFMRSLKQARQLLEEIQCIETSSARLSGTQEPFSFQLYLEHWLAANGKYPAHIAMIEQAINPIPVSERPLAVKLAQGVSEELALLLKGITPPTVSSPSKIIPGGRGAFRPTSPTLPANHQGTLGRAGSTRGAFSRPASPLDPRQGPQAWLHTPEQKGSTNSANGGKENPYSLLIGKSASHQFSLFSSYPPVDTNNKNNNNHSYSSVNPNCND